MAAKAAISFIIKENRMLSVKKIKNSIKNTLVTMLELVYVRLDMARIELIQQRNSFITILAAILVACVCLLVAFISFLFGLNSILPAEMQKVVFFAISGGALFFCLLIFLGIWYFLKKQNGFMSLTLEEVRRDIFAIKNMLNTSKDDL